MTLGNHWCEAHRPRPPRRKTDMVDWYGEGCRTCGRVKGIWRRIQEVNEVYTQPWDAWLRQPPVPPLTPPSVS